MATKVEDVLQKVRALGYATDTEESQIEMINSVHKRVLNARRWSFIFNTDASKTLSVGVGTLAYDALAATRRIDAVRLEIGTEFIELTPMNQAEFRRLEHVERQNGTPEAWTREGTNLAFWPRPDQAYKVIVDYATSPPELTAKTDVVQIPDSHVDILAYGVVIDLTFRERDWDGHNFARQLYSELFAEMLAQFGQTNRQASSHVVSSGEWEHFDVEAFPWLI